MFHGIDQASSGILNLNKPSGISSARAVALVKRRLPKGVKIGHAGTLDPFATGVLLLLVGKATRLCEKLMNQPKEYKAVVKFGATTPTDDPESAEVPWDDVVEVAQEQVEAALKNFEGEILQRPPVFSAMKVGGRRAYDLARRGDDVELEPRPVRIYRLEMLNYNWPFARLRIECGRGTYVRALARDLGEALGCGGYLTELVRTRIGQFSLSNSVTLEQLAELSLESHIIPLTQIAQL